MFSRKIDTENSFVIDKIDQKGYLYNMHIYI